jgi:hypothetical protein
MTCGITLQNDLMVGAARHNGAVPVVVPGTGIGAGPRAIAPAAHAHAPAEMAEKWLARTTYQPVSPVFSTDRPNPRLPERSP